MSERMIALGKSGDFFGPLYPYIIDDDVTDVDYNGREVWITDSDNCRHVCKDLILSQDFVDQFTGRVANGVSKAFNLGYTAAEVDGNLIDKSNYTAKEGESAHYHCA